MDATGDAGKYLDQAIEQAKDVINAMTRGSEVAVIQTGGKPVPLFDQPLFDPSLVSDRLSQVKGGMGASHMRESLNLAFATLRNMSNARRELIVISDFQSSDWSANTDSWAVSIRRELDSIEFPPAVTLMRVGEATHGNISVDGLDLSRTALGVGQELLIRANIKNHGATRYDKARAALVVDGTEESMSQVDLAGETTTQALFSYRFESPGSHVLAVQLEVDDPLSTDNSAAAAVNVWDRIDIVLVDGAPNSRPLQSETDYLSVALTPFTLGRIKLADLIQTRKLAVRELKSESIEGARVVVMANVPKLTAEQLSSLTDYVRAGGSLLIFPGDRIDVAWYNDSMYADQGGLLPLPFGIPPNESRAAAPAAHIVSQHFDHPALELFNQPANGDLSTAEIRRWYRLGKPEDPTAVAREGDETRGRTESLVSATVVTLDDAVLTVIASLDTGDPLLVQKRVGDGLVIQAATACDADWSDLPMRPVYVPLMQQLVITMASQVSPPRNVLTGQPLVALLPGTVARLHCR